MCLSNAYFGDFILKFAGSLIIISFLVYCKPKLYIMYVTFLLNYFVSINSSFKIN